MTEILRGIRLRVAVFRMNYHRRKHALLEAQADAQLDRQAYWANRVGELRWDDR